MESLSSDTSVQTWGLSKRLAEEIEQEQRENDDSRRKLQDHSLRFCYPKDIQPCLFEQIAIRQLSRDLSLMFFGKFLLIKVSIHDFLLFFDKRLKGTFFISNQRRQMRCPGVYVQYSNSSPEPTDKLAGCFNPFPAEL